MRNVFLIFGNASQIRRLVRFAIPVLTAGIFFLDWLTPLGVVDWVLYFIPLLLSFYAGARFSPMLLAIVFSTLTGMGFYLSPPGLEPGLALINLLLGLGTLWVVAFLVARLRTSERFLHSTLDAISAHIAILNERGVIVSVNSAWSRFASQNNCLANNFGINANYLALCESATGSGADDASAVAQGIRSVMTGRCAGFILEYPCHSPQEQRWFAVRVTRFTGEGPVHVVVAHENITARKEAEAELQWKTAFLEAQVNSSIDGILVVDGLGKKTLQNQRLTDLMKIPQSIADEKDDERQRQWVMGAAKNPESFIERVMYLNSHPDEISRDEFELNDGMILDRYSAPLLGKDGKYYGRLWTFRDITARRRAEAVLRDNEQRMRLQTAALESCANGVAITDFKGTIQWGNEGLARLTGYSLPELVGQNPRIFKSGKQSESFDKELWQTICQGRVWSGEIINRHKSGQLYFEEMTITPVRNESGRITHFIAIKQDITKRKRSEESLRRSEEKFRGLVENLHEAVVTVDLATQKFISANPAAIKMFDAKDEGELISSNPRDLSPERQPDGSLSMERAGKRMEGLDEGPQCFEWMHRRISGAEFYTEVILTRMDRDEKPAFLATIRDITERNLAEKTLREKERMLSESQRLAHIGSWMGNMTGRMSWSEETYRIYGVSPDTFIPTLETSLSLVHPVDRPVVLEWMTRCAAGQKPAELEFRINRSDGSIRFIKRNGEAVHDAENRFNHMAGTVQDITESKEAQAAQKIMECRVDEHRASEEKARLALLYEQKSSQLKDRFVRMVSHEFRTPLSIITMAAELLNGYLDKLTDAERSEHLADIRSSVERMTQLMSDFLIHTNCAGNKVEYQPEWVEVEALCRQLISELPHSAGSPRVIECAVEPSVGQVWLDDKIVRVILGNLLSNALKYSAAGQRVTLEVKRVAGNPPQNGSSVPLPLTHLEFKISDSGIGIPTADLAKLYQTFHRAANVGNRPGTGMGLAIVKQFVDLHIGTIRYESEEGKGTTVWVGLPAAAPAQTGS